MTKCARISGRSASKTSTTPLACVVDRFSCGRILPVLQRQYGEGFFFEIVERRGYRGYGAANAIRIAALKKQIWPDGMPVIGREQPKH